MTPIPIGPLIRIAIVIACVFTVGFMAGRSTRHFSRAITKAEHQGWCKGMLGFMRIIENNSFLYHVADTNQWNEVKAEIQQQLEANK